MQGPGPYTRHDRHAGRNNARKGEQRTLALSSDLLRGEGRRRTHVRCNAGSIGLCFMLLRTPLCPLWCS